MEPQSLPTLNLQKVSETVEKLADLIRENKVYEFTQKIQLLTHRKEQSKKFQEAQFLLQCAVQKLISLTSSQNNQALSLLDHLLKIYEAHPQTWSKEKGGNFPTNAVRIYQLLNIKIIQRKYQYYVRFLKTLKNQPFPKDMILDLIDHYLRNDQFTKAESHVLQLDLPTLKKFLERWASKVNRQEAIAIQCRIALLRGLVANFDESREVLAGVDQENPFFKFTNFLISASTLKSKEAYSLIGTRYKQFLDSDEMYNKIYEGYGTFYFNINSSKNSSLLSLFK